MTDEMLTDERRAEIEARIALEKTAFDQATNWARRACQVGAADGFMLVTFNGGELFMMESDVVAERHATDEMITRLTVKLSEFFGVDLVQLTMKSFGGGDIN